ncbi:hypothetical protein IU397_01895 [Actibacterium sp. 188UL27-1]|nr:hypothetical protein [Actibacterium sp. 188UL27-1]
MLLNKLADTVLVSLFYDTNFFGSSGFDLNYYVYELGIGFTNALAHAVTMIPLILILQDTIAGRALRLRHSVTQIPVNLLPVAVAFWLVNHSPSVAALLLLIDLPHIRAIVSLLFSGLFIFAAVVWFVASPLVVIERQGWRAFGRSYRLVSRYRWPVFGVFVVVTLILMLVLVASEFSVTYGQWVFAEILNFAAYLCTAFEVTVTVLTYNRLCAIKEGAQPEDLAAVFE